MATTSTDLYRSLMGEMGKTFKNLKVGIYPGDGILYPRWVDTQRFSKKEDKWVTDRADVTVVVGKDGPEVEAGGGTSLHDVSGWFPCKDFWIPEGTEYSTDIYIRKDAKKKKSAFSKFEGFHYQLEPSKLMTVTTFKGALDNMARAAVVRQCRLATL